MNNPWKLGIIGLAVASVTALTSGLTTAFLMRPAVPPDTRAVATTLEERVGARSWQPVVVSPARPVSAAPAVRPTKVVRAAARSTGEASLREVARSTQVTEARPTAVSASIPSVPASDASATAERPGEVTPSTPITVPAPVATQPAAAPTSTTTAGAPADCATGGSRAWRIAKPGAVGGLVGAGAGAVGGAIADGGKGAGKGAMIGGLAGAALGSAWGAYKTKNECGTIFGGTASASPAGRAGDPRIEASAPADASGSDTVQTPFAPAASGGGITVYSVR